MKNQKGIWIDKQKAFVITLSENTQSVEQIDSEIVSRERISGEGKDSSRFGKQDVNTEKKKDSRLNHQTSSFLERIISSISNTDHLVIFGPAEMKVELEKMILDNSELKSIPYSIRTADNMTENQMVAWVKDFFQ